LILKNCQYCKKEFKARRNSQKFCSRSCLGLNINRVVKGFVPPLCGCGKKKYKTSKLCNECRQKTIRKKKEEKTIKSLAVLNSHPMYKNNVIRKHAKKVMMDKKIDKICIICDYNEHVECCHIKPISKFSDDAKLKDVNAKENLIYLCPNHHWEQENKIDFVKKYKEILKPFVE
jgi:hypothetical protein